jgi:hypothetical protein
VEGSNCIAQAHADVCTKLRSIVLTVTTSQHFVKQNICADVCTSCDVPDVNPHVMIIRSLHQIF